MAKSILFAIDFDRTWTEDPDFWHQFIALATMRGHRCIVATGRHAWSEDMDRHNLPDIPIVWCKGKLKGEACREAGHRVDIWIDDMPGMIQNCIILPDAPDASL
jgi:hypothetical protein